MDTLSQFAGLQGESENNAGDALAALDPLQRIAAKGRAVLVVRHERKGGGEVGESGRGSSAFAGAVDIVLALRRPEGHTRPTIRIVHALSRFDDTPETLAVERVTDAAVSAAPSVGVPAESFRALGSERAVIAHEAREALLDDLPRSPDAAVDFTTFLESHKHLKRTASQTALDVLVTERVVTRTGSGKKKDPYRYFQPVDLSAGTTHPYRQHEFTAEVTRG